MAMPHGLLDFGPTPQSLCAHIRHEMPSVACDHRNVFSKKEVRVGEVPEGAGAETRFRSRPLWHPRIKNFGI